MDKDDGASARREPRDSLFMSATIARVGDAQQPARIRNLSGGGMLIECSSLFVAGDRVQIELRGVGLVEGAIAWVDGGRCGVAFDRRIDPSLARRPLKDAQQPVLVKAATSTYRPRLKDAGPELAPMSLTPRRFPR